MLGSRPPLMQAIRLDDGAIVFPGTRYTGQGSTMSIEVRQMTNDLFAAYWTSL